MRREVILALGLASISGLFAVMGINEWMSSEYSKLMQNQKPAAAEIEMTKVVVAKEDLAFGVAVTRDKLQEAEWPAKNVPHGAFNSIDEFLKQQDTRIVLEPLAADEPVINGKVTGPGQRSGLATMLEPGKKAVTIRINDVVGVGGLVLPGDRVDIFVTNEAKNMKNKDGSDTEPYTELLLKNVRVLAVDQILDPKHTAPILGRTVTVESSLVDAQKITLASTIGSLSLVLRENSPSVAEETTKRLSVADLSGNSGDNSHAAAFVPAIAVAPETKPVAPSADTKSDGQAKVRVVRSTAPTEYSVPRLGAGE